jgi:hypothetical protein
LRNRVAEWKFSIERLKVFSIKKKAIFYEVKTKKNTVVAHLPNGVLYKAIY